MKISYNWLRDYVHTDLSPAKIGQILTNTGLEVESIEKIETIKGGLHGVVIGEVKTCFKHPDADKLSVTTVDIGNGTILPIVCGAPNVAAGQKVVVATVGTVLYAGNQSFEIKKAKIRGQVSEGMICAEDEIGIGDSHAGIMVLPNEAVVGTPAREYFDIEEDYVFEIGLTPNRTDAMSHIGVARDLVTALNLHELNEPLSLRKPCVDSFMVDNITRPFEIVIDDPKACPRYTGITVSGVEVKESPDWLKNRLLAIGLRPINNLVDISNYVLHETGHPTHFFDADKVKGDKIVIKKLPAGTKFKTLDETDRTLSGNDLMICNADEGMCIAGVFGGFDSGVTTETKNVFIESAYFDPKIIRKTARFHGLNTDSSFRFERGADPEATVYALKRCAMLIRQLAGGVISSEVTDVYPKPLEKSKIELKYKNADRLIGKSIDRDTIKDILIWLGIEIENEDEHGLVAEIPTFKADVKLEADLIEEILRIYGYNNVEIPDQLRSSLSYIEKPDREKVQNLVADYLSANGFLEIMNNSLTKASYSEMLEFLKAENNVQLANPLSADLGVMRQTLLTSGLESIVYNLNRKNSDLKFYEFGKTYVKNPQHAGHENILKKYHEFMNLSVFLTGNDKSESWYTSQGETDFYLLKSFVFNALKKLNIQHSEFTASPLTNEIFGSGLQYEINNKVAVQMGPLHKKLLHKFDIKQEVFWANINWDMMLQLLKKHKVSYKEVSKYPEVRRDLALLIDKEVTFETLEKIAFDAEKNILKSVNLFDVYEGENLEKNKKSYALSFVLLDETKTLTDKIIDKTMQKIIKAFEMRVNAKLR